MLFYLLASLGLMFILKYGTIFDFLRNFVTSKSEKLKELFKCSLCLGFWTGVIIAYFAVKDLTTGEHLMFPFASAAFCNIVDMLLDKFLES